MFTPESEYIRSSRRPDGGNGRGILISQEEFWRAWNENEPYLLQLCTVWMKGDRSEAREALSGAMMHAVEGSTIDRLPEIGNIRAWLVKIVKNHCIDLQRQQSRRIVQTEAFDYLTDLVEAVGQGGQEVSPETGFVRHENYQQLLHAFESLPERLREVMMLRAYQNMPYKEIAHHLCITADAARKRAEQGRSLLIQRLRRETFPARGPRSAHDAGINPRSERRAAEEILQRPSVSGFVPSRHAHLREIRLDGGRSIEMMVFLDRRPIRLEQRLETAKRYMQRHPGGWTRQKEFADLLLIVGQPEEAAQHYQAVLSRQPQLFSVAESLANCLSQIGRVAEAIRVLNIAMGNLPTAEQKAHFRAKLARLNGDSDMAMEKWQEAATQSDDWRRYFMDQAQLCLQTGEDARAQALLDAVLAGTPKDRRAFHLALECARKLQDRETYHNLIEWGRREFMADASVTATWMLWHIGEGDLSDDLRQSISDSFGKLKGQLSGTALGIHAMAAWSFQAGRKNACHRMVHDFVLANPGLREGLMVGAFWMERLGDHNLATELTAGKKRLFGTNKLIPTSYLNALWQNL